MSTNAASVSGIIPFVRMLEKSLEKQHESHNDRDVQTMKHMLKLLKQWYANAESNDNQYCSQS